MTGCDSSQRNEWFICDLETISDFINSTGLVRLLSSQAHDKMNGTVTIVYNHYPAESRHAEMQGPDHKLSYYSTKH